MQSLKGVCGSGKQDELRILYLDGEIMNVDLVAQGTM